MRYITANDSLKTWPAVLVAMAMSVITREIVGKHFSVAGNV